jgi:PAS domain S-box-containing protein
MARAALPQQDESERVSELRALYRLTDRLYRSRSLDEVFEAALDTIVRTLGCDRASILVFDECSVMRFVASRGLSDHYRKTLEGHSPWVPDDDDPDPIFVEDIEATSEAPEVIATIRAEDIRSLGFIPLCVNGKVVGKFMTYYQKRHQFTPHDIDLATTIARQVGFSLGRARAEASHRQALEELRLSEERFRLMSENAPVMIWMSDSKGDCLHLNRMLRDFWGVSDDFANFDWRDTMHPEDIDHIISAMMQAAVSRAPVTVHGRYLNADGEYRVLRTEARPRLSATGEFQGMIGVNVDVTEQERAEAQRELLFRELNHRVKNTLAVVQAISHQIFRDEQDNPSVAAFERRLRNLAQAHNLLTRQNWESTPLHQLALDALAGQGADLNRITLNGPSVMLPPQQALALTMALHELHTNALKHGALSRQKGRVMVDWYQAKDEPQRLVLTWTERGGPPVSQPERRGFGSFLIENVVASDLDGRVTLDFAPGGLSCRIEALTNGAAAS